MVLLSHLLGSSRGVLLLVCSPLHVPPHSLPVYSVKSTVVLELHVKAAYSMSPQHHWRRKSITMEKNDKRMEIDSGSADGPKHKATVMVVLLALAIPAVLCF